MNGFHALTSLCLQRVRLQKRADEMERLEAMRKAEEQKRKEEEVGNFRPGKSCANIYM